MKLTDPYSWDMQEDLEDAKESRSGANRQQQNEIIMEGRRMTINEVIAM